MIQWVYERAASSLATEVLIATDDLLIVSAAHSFGAETVMTASTHSSGTDRIAEVARLRRWPTDDIVVNVQGDEPMIPPALIDQAAAVLEANPRADIATLATPILTLQEFLDPNAVKVVTDTQGRALYFSRAPIPWNRDAAPEGIARPRSPARSVPEGPAPAGPLATALFAGSRRHVGIYAYRVGALLRMAALAPTALELREKLEQLRALENGLEIRVAETFERPGPDVNTAADFERVGALLGD